MAITAANLTTGTRSTASTSDDTTASITTASGRSSLLAVVSVLGATPNTPGITDASRTWTQQGTSLLFDDTGSARGRITLFRTTTAATGAVTITWAGQSHIACWSIDEFTGIDTGGTNGSNGFINQVNSAIDAFAQSATVTLAAFSDAGNGTYSATGLGSGNVAITPEASWTELADVANTGGMRLQTQWRADNDTTPSCSWTGFHNWGMSGLELVAAASVSAAVTGTATAGINEADVVTGGKTIILTLTGDTWVASGGTFDGIRQDIIDGLDSAQAEGTGWNAEVRDNLAVTTVVRTSDTIVTVTLSAQAAYNITATETITVTVPASALTGASPLVATPTFTVVPVATAVVTGTATASINETDVVAGGKTIIITLTDDTWVASGGTFDGIRQDIIDGLDSAQSEGTGWNTEVRDNLAVTTVVRTSNTVVTITLSAQAAYNITAPETITVTVPATAVVLGAAIIATPTFTIDIAGGSTAAVVRNKAAIRRRNRFL